VLAVLFIEGEASGSINLIYICSFKLVWYLNCSYQYKGFGKQNFLTDKFTIVLLSKGSLQRIFI